MNKILEIFTDRRGKVSPYKIAWMVTLFSMLYVIIFTSIAKAELVEIPQTWIGFLGVASGTGLTRSWLANKNEKDLPKSQN